MRAFFVGMVVLAGLSQAPVHVAAQEGAQELSSVQSISTAGSLDCANPAVGEHACVLKLAPGADVPDIKAEDVASGDQRVIDVTQMTSFVAAQGDGAPRHQIIILLDDSTSAAHETVRQTYPSGARRQTLGQVREAFVSLVATLPQNADVAVFAYDALPRVLKGFDAAMQDPVDIAAQLTFEGTTTQTFAAIDHAIGLLGQRPGLSHAIYVITDGAAEDASGVGAAVTARAIDAGVSVSAMIVHWLREGAVARGEYNSIFQTLATQTGGASDIINSGDALPEDSRVLGAASNSQNGRIIRVQAPTGDTRVTVKIEYDGGDGAGDAGVTITAVLKAETIEEGPTETPPQPGPPTFAEKLKDFWDRYTLWIIVAFVVLLILLLLLALWVIRQRQRAAEIEAEEAEQRRLQHEREQADGARDQSATTQITSIGIIGVAPDKPGPVLAQLRMSTDGSIADIRKRKVSIGRSSDNDIPINDDSVSRVHCEIYVTREGDFAITDLQSLNKTRVNDAVVETRHLNNGDIIRIGEVEFAFLSGPQVTS